MALGGFAASQVGVVADVQVSKQTGKILVKHLYAAQINGLTISPGLVENQMSGNLIQGLSRGLLEELTFSKSRVTSLAWRRRRRSRGCVWGRAWRQALLRGDVAECRRERPRYLESFLVGG
jgi:Molybdopterin cofactor-binding domain